MNTRLCAAVGFVLSLLLVPAGASAQHWSFSIGHGHHHDYHHHHCWDDFWCGPHFDYVYVAPPPPVIRREIRYIEPPVEQVVETRVVAPRATASAATSSATTSNLQIWNSAGQRVAVAFLADGQQVALSDGQSHTFYGGGSRTIEFDRGGDFGTGRMVLNWGQYEFVVGDRGWDLVRRLPGSSTGARVAAPRNALPTNTLTR